MFYNNNTSSSAPRSHSALEISIRAREQEKDQAILNAEYQAELAHQKKAPRGLLVQILASMRIF